MKKIAEIKKSGSNKECDNGIYKIVKQMKRDNKDFFNKKCVLDDNENRVLSRWLKQCMGKT